MTTNKENNNIILGLNLLIFIIYATIIFCLSSVALTNLVLLILLQMGICLVIGVITGNRIWFLSALLVLLISLGTCFAFVYIISKSSK